jgi:hypothetical protein
MCPQGLTPCWKGRWELHTPRSQIGVEACSQSPGHRESEEGVVNFAQRKGRTLTFSSSTLDHLLISGQRSVLYVCD